MRIYVASSWRNPHQASVVADLRRAGHLVYDFKHPHPDHRGFAWSEIDPAWGDWTPGQYREALSHPAAERGFSLDMDALLLADACIFVAPAGRSAALELGYAVGRGKRTAAFIYPGQEPDLMFKMCDRIFVSVDEMLIWVATPYRPVPAKVSDIERAIGSFS